MTTALARWCMTLTASSLPAADKETIKAVAEVLVYNGFSDVDQLRCAPPAADWLHVDHLTLVDFAYLQELCDSLRAATPPAAAAYYTTPLLLQGKLPHLLPPFTRQLDSRKSFARSG